MADDRNGDSWGWVPAGLSPGFWERNCGNARLVVCDVRELTGDKDSLRWGWMVEIDNEAVSVGTDEFAVPAMISAEIELVVRSGINI